MRPMPVLSLCSAVLFLLLLALGSWQWQRASSKSRQQLQLQYSSPAPDSLSDALCANPPRTFPANLVKTKHTPHIRVYGQDTSGHPGWREFSAITPPSCLKIQGLLLLEQAFHPDRKNVAASPTMSLRPENWPVHSAFAPRNRPDKNEWYWFDPEAIARYIGATPSTKMILLNADYQRYLLNRIPPSRHYAYAVTWFCLALALAAIYTIYHRQAGRL